MNKYIRVILILQLSVLATRGSAIAQDWEKVNSPYGSIRAVVTTNNKTIIVGTGNGILLSTDKGNHWTSSNSGIIDKYICSLAKIENIVLAGTRHGVYRSLDNGKSWIKTSLPDTTYDLMMTSPKGIVFTQIENGDLYSTTDNGSNWRSLNVDISTGYKKVFFNISQLIMDDNGNLLFPFDSCSFLKSTNDGMNWKRIFVKGSAAHEWLRIAAKGNTIIVGTWKHGIMRSTDDGTTWEKMNPPKGDNLAVYYTNTGNIFLEMDDPYGKYESSDDGTTWNTINSPLRIVSSDRYDGDTIYAIARIESGSALVRSIDAGKSWNSLMSSFHNINVIETNTAGELYAGTEWCGAYRSRDYGENWEPVLDVSGIENIVFANKMCIALSTSISGVFTADGRGRAWNSAAAYGLIDFRINSLVSTKNGTLLAGGTSEIVMLPAKDGRGSILTHKGGGLWRSTNQGASWNRIIFDKSYSTKDNGKTWAKYDSVWKRRTIDTLQPDFSVNSLGIDPDGHIRLNANCDYRTGIYISSNEGASWNKLQDIDRYENVRTSFIQTASEEIFSGISRSTDRGVTFKDVVNGLSTPRSNNLQPLPHGDMLASTGNGLFYLPQGGNRWYCVGFKDIDVKCTVFNGGYVFVSADYGYEDERNGLYRKRLLEIQTLIPKNIVERELWQEIKQPLHNKLEHFSIDRLGTLWVVNEKGELARSTDQGTHWILSELPDRFLQSMTTDAGDQTVFLGSFGGFFQSKTQGNTWEKVLFTEQDDELNSPYVHSVFLDVDGTIFLGVSQEGPFRNPCADTSKNIMSYISLGRSRYGRIYFRKPHTSKWIPSDSVLPGSPDQILRDKKGILYASVRGEGIYHSTDGGNAWRECNNGLLQKGGIYTCNIGAELDRSVNGMVKDAKGRIYAIRASGQLYRLQNDGQSWDYLNALGGFGSSLIINSHNDLYLGTEAGVFLSKDEGKNWESYSAGLTSCSIIEIAAHPSGHLFAVTEDGHIYKSILKIESNQK